MLASLAAFCGVAIIVGNARAGSDILGIGLACLMTVAIAAMTVAVRRHKNTPMVAAAALSNVLGSIVSIPFAHGIASVTGAELVILAMFGSFQVALGLTLFVLGSRLLPSGQASLIATLETPLMPFWVWLAFQEVPALRALVGGALVMGAGYCRHHRRYPRAETIALTSAAAPHFLRSVPRVLLVCSEIHGTRSDVGRREWRGSFRSCRISPDVRGACEMDAADLRVFQSVADTGSMNKAALELNTDRQDYLTANGD